MIYLGGTLAVITSFLLIIATIAFLRAKDVFMMVHIVKITNFYITPLLLLAIWLEHFSLVSLAKILALIILNIVITKLLCYAIVRKALASKIKLDSK